MPLDHGIYTRHGSFAAYVEPTTDMALAYRAHIRAQGKEPSLRKWVASLCQDLTNDDTNRTAEACAKVWEEITAATAAATDPNKYVGA